MSADTSEEMRLHLDQAHIFVDLVDPNAVVDELEVCELPAGAFEAPAKKLKVVRTLVKLEDQAPAPYRVPKKEPEQTENPKLRKGQAWVIQPKAEEGVEIKPKVKKRAAKSGRRSGGVIQPKLEERATLPGQQPSGVIQPKAEERAAKLGHRPRQPSLIPFDAKDLPESLQCLVCSQEGLTATQLTQHFAERHLRATSQTEGEVLLEPQLLGYCCPECGLCQETLEPMLAHYALEHPTSELLLGELRRREPLQPQLAQLCLLCVRYFRLAGHYYSAHRCFNRVDEAGLEALVRELRRPPCYWCDVCAATFRWKVQYRLHRQTRHRSVTAIDWEALRPAQIPYVCDACHRGFVEEATMRGHLCGLDAAAAAAEMEVRPVRRRYCPYCERHFGCDSSLKYHVATRHTHQKIPPRDRNRRRAPTIECPFCALKFKLSKQLALHTLTVHGRKLSSPFYCAKCECTFRSNKGLQMHKAECAGGEGPRLRAGDDSRQLRNACAGGDDESQQLRKTGAGGDESQQLRKECAGAESLQLRKVCAGDDSQQLRNACAGGDERQPLRKECAGGAEKQQLRKECAGGAERQQPRNEYPSGELAARMCAVACKLSEEGELLYECDVCGREFDQPGDYFAHRSSHEVRSDAAVVECEYCRREFKSKLAVNIHHTIAHKDEIALERAQEMALEQEAPLKSITRENGD